MVRQLHMKQGNVKSLLKLQVGDKVGPVPEQEDNLADMERAWGDVNGKELDSKGGQGGSCQGNDIYPQ